MRLVLRTVESGDVDDLVAVALRAWAPVFASTAMVLGDGLNARIYPDWQAEKERDVRSACADPHTDVTVATDGRVVLGFVAVLLRSADATGMIDMIAVDPAVQRHGIARALIEHALAQMRAAGCTLAMLATGGDAGHAPARALYEATGFTGLPLARYYRLLDPAEPEQAT